MWRWNNGDAELYHYGVLGMKWGVHRAKSYQEKSNRARARGNMTDAQKYQNKSDRITAKHERLAGGKKTMNRVSKQSMGKTMAQTAVFGTYGALKYNQARAKHASRGRAAVEATLYNAGNKLTGGVLGVAEPRLHKSGKSGARTTSKTSKTARKSNGSAVSQKKYVEAHNRAAAKINDSSNHILSDFNKKWEGRYNTAAYQQAYTEMFNKLLEDELRR